VIPNGAKITPRTFATGISISFYPSYVLVSENPASPEYFDLGLGTGRLQ